MDYIEKLEKQIEKELKKEEKKEEKKWCQEDKECERAYRKGRKLIEEKYSKFFD